MGFELLRLLPSALRHHRLGRCLLGQRHRLLAERRVRLPTTTASTAARSIIGRSGSGNGDDFFAANLQQSPRPSSSATTYELDVFGEVFNVTNNTNYGLYVDQTEFNLDTMPNPNYENPTGNEVGQSRTYNLGVRFRF